MSETPTWAEVIRTALEASKAGLHVSTPGIVESYDPETQTATVKPTLPRPSLTRDGYEFLDLPVLPRVPIKFERAGGFFISYPVAKGDRVMLVFMDRSMDQWSELGREGDPRDGRTHDLSDGVAIVGLYPASEPLADAHATNMVLGKDGGVQIHIKPSGEIHIGSENAADFIALAALVLSELQAIKTAYDLHTHTGVTTGPGVSGTPVLPMPAPSSVAASKVKAD